MAKKVTKANEVSENDDNIEIPEIIKTIETTTITEDMVKYVRENVQRMSYSEMGKELGLTSNKVSNILQNYKRKLRSNIGYENYEKRTYVNQKGKEVTKPDFTKPKSEKAKKVETWITENLSRPVKASNMSDALNGDVDDVLSKL